MTIMQLAESFGLTEDGLLKGSTNTAHRQLDPKRAGALAEAAEIWGKAWGGSRMHALLANEALATSDLFVSATGDLLDRELLAQFQEIPTVWSQLATRSDVRNFKPKKLVDIMGGRTTLEAVPELTEYPNEVYTTAEYSISASKFGRRFGYSWEAGINDDLGEIQQVPSAFARAAALTEETAFLQQLTGSLTTGVPNTAFFKSYNTAAAALLGYTAFNNSSALALTSANLEAAITDIGGRKDAQGNLLPGPRLKLVVGKALEFVARKILSQTLVRTTVSSGQIEGPNILAGAVDLVVHPSLPGVNWFLLPDVNTGRPAIAVAHLRGFETPDLRVSSNTGSRIGGGSISPEEGSFEVDGVWYRVRHVVGAATVDPIFTWGSTGVTGTPGV